MSSGQNPRTPRYFPKMKVRGASRKRRAMWDETLRGFDLLGVASQKAANSLQEWTLRMSVGRSQSEMRRSFE